MMPELPLVEELPAWLDSVTAFTKLRNESGVIFFDSAQRHDLLGRYSFVSAWPESISLHSSWNLRADSSADNELQIPLPGEVRTIPGLPPFQGGTVALLAYDFGGRFERLREPLNDEFGLPALATAVYDVVLAYDHEQERGWIISQGMPWAEADYASQRMRQFKRFLFEGVREEVWTGIHSSYIDDCPAFHPRSLHISELVPQYRVGPLPRLTSNFSREEYLRAVRRAVEYIHAGDVFQVNLSQRLLYPAQGESADLYLRLRERNPATFAGYFDIGDFQIISASPERFLSVRDGVVEARPIKGTRGRSSRPEADLFAADDLQQSEKDRAENVMIVDLMRNDLAKVCEPDSVNVTQLCGLETYQFVQHLVSVVQGKLRPEVSPIDVLRATFPGGSITGAPKVRAMEIIAELEPTARGAYCGCLGYIGFDGTMDWNILIRTITAGRGWWQLPVGGGIVAQSDPEREYDETWQKALGMIKALR